MHAYWYLYAEQPYLAPELRPSVASFPCDYCDERAPMLTATRWGLVCGECLVVLPDLGGEG